MSTLATKSPGPANVPDREKPVISTESPKSAELFGSTRAPVSAKSPGRAKAADSEELAGPIVVGRPPAQLLAPSPTPEERIPGSFPHTTPERPWDRLCVAARKPSKTTWDEEGPQLDAELPPDAPKGTSLIGSIVKGRAPWTCRPRILKVLANKPLARVIEAAAAVYDGQRVRAACLRMEFLRGRWKVVALEIA